MLAERVPDVPVSSKGGRPALDKRTALRGIFWILDNRAKLKDLPRRFGSTSAVRLWFTVSVRAGAVERLLRDAARAKTNKAGAWSAGLGEFRSIVDG